MLAEAEREMIRSISLGAVIELVTVAAAFAILGNKTATLTCFFAAMALGAVTELMTPDHEEEWTEEREEKTA